MIGFESRGYANSSLTLTIATNWGNHTYFVGRQSIRHHGSRFINSRVIDGDTGHLEIVAVGKNNATTLESYSSYKLP